MKYYKTTFDLNVPTKDRVAVAANSDYGLAVELWKNGEKVQLAASDAKIVDGATTISADSTDNGLAVFNLSSSFEGGSKVVTVAFDKPAEGGVDGAKGNFLLELAAEDKGAYFKKDSEGGGSGGDTTLSATTAYTDWVVSPAKWTVADGTTYVLSAPQYGDFNDQGEPKHGWHWVNPEDTELVYDLGSDDPTETSLTARWQEMAGVTVNVSFSREAVVGYQLGDQSDKILADRNTVKSLVAGVVEDFGPWRVFSDDGTAVSNARVVWSAGGNAWIMYDGSGNVIGEAENGEIGNNLIFCEGNLNRYAYRRHTFTCPNGVEIQAAPSVNGFSANIDTVRISHMVVMGLLNHYGANLYVYSD